MIIKYCCYYCKHLDECMGLVNARGKPCYNAMGGKEYMEFCDTKDGECVTHSSAGGTIGEANKNCWEARSRE